MITVTPDTYVPYSEIPTKNPSQIPDVVVYPNIFESIVPKMRACLKKIKHVHRKYNTSPKDKIKVLMNSVVKLLGISFNSYVINGPPRFHEGPYATILFIDHTANFRSKKRKNNLVKLTYTKGTLLVFRSTFDTYWSYTFPKRMVVTFFNEDITPLCDIYLNRDLRLDFAKVVRDKLAHIAKNPIGKQCIEKYVKEGSMLGQGDYGNVYKTNLSDFNFAIKLGKLKPDAIQRPYSRYNSSWYEILIMKDILNPMVEYNICPNLPYLIDSFVCDDCKLTIRKVTSRQPCIITITELAKGTLRDFFKKKKISEKHQVSALFQIMAGLHAIQLNGQIMNFDVKPDNILYYKVTPGGYWKYTVHGKNFYVPNMGKLFILNDFGISRPMSPDFQLYREDNEKTFRLGSRFAIVKNGVFSPLHAELEPNSVGHMNSAPEVKWTDGSVSRGAQFRLMRNNQKILDCKTRLSVSQYKFLTKYSISTNSQNKDFFLHPEVIPPFEFYNDTQDLIRCFTGGKRTTQRGNHTKYPTITDNLCKVLKLYSGKTDSMADRVFSKDPAHVLAGYFIESFFTKYTKYTNIPNDCNIIGEYNMS